MVMVKQNPYAPEEAVYILRTPPRPLPPEYQVVHARARQPIAFNEASVSADFSEAAIDPSAVHALERSWGVMAREARWPDREGEIARMKWGGVHFTFDYRGDNVYGQGDTVSPERGTCAASLVEIGDLLIRFVDEPDGQKRAALQLRLANESRALSERLK